MKTDSDYKIEACFPRFIIIGSMETPITNLSPFVIEKVISSNIKHITAKNLRTKPCQWKWKKEIKQISY